MIPAIRDFFKARGEKIPADLEKKALLDWIESYANSSEDNNELVSEWLDRIILEGIKEIVLQPCRLSHAMAAILSNADDAHAYFEARLTKGVAHHFCGNAYSGDPYYFFKYDYENGKHGRVIRLYFCKKVHFGENRNGTVSSRPVEFPIIVEYYLDHSWLCTRYKQRSNLYDFCEKGFSAESIHLSYSKELKEITTTAMQLLGAENTTPNINGVKIRKALFSLLDQYTHTPEEITTLLQMKRNEIATAIDTIMRVCNLDTSSLASVSEDVSTLTEKYLSINWEDKSVFTKNRDAYPTFLSVKDEESSQIDQHTAFNSPLQASAVFFDNKRMIYNQKSCQGIVFRWKKLIQDKQNIDTFPVRISEDHGRCILKFVQYTVEEDIENVLFSVIDAGR